MVAFASERRIPTDVSENILKLLIKARQEGRLQEMVAVAHREAADLQQWTCSACGESNPGTFELCWNCSTDAESRSRGLSDESQVILTLDARFRLIAEKEAASREDD